MVRVTQGQLERANTQINDLVEAIYSLPTECRELHRDFLIAFSDTFAKSSAVREVFCILNTQKYWDYLNIDILENIITEFSLPSQTQLKNYKRQRQQFMEQTTVKEFCEAEGDRRHIDPPPAFVKLISQHEWEPPTYLKKVDEFCKKFALKYDLRESAVILVGMRGG